MSTYLTKLREQRAEREDEGFTLIELLVVLLIIGILLAIAIPTFLTVTKSASSTAAESNLQTALTGSATYYTQNGGSFTGIETTGGTASDIAGQGTGLNYVTGSAASTAAGVVSIKVISSDTIVLAGWSKGNGRCYAILDQQVAPSAAFGNAPTAVGTYYGWFTAAASSTCTAAGATAVSGTAGAAGEWQSTGGFPA